MRVPFAIFLFVVSAVVHVVGLRWVLARFPSLARPSRRLPLIVLAGVLTIAAPGARVLSRVSSSRLFVNLLAVATLEMFAATVTVVLVAIGAVLVKLATRRGPEPAPAPAPALEPELPRREALSRLAGVGVYGLSLSTFGWGMAKGRLDFQLEDVVVRIPGLPRVLDGYTIVQVSDVHVGAFIGERELAQGFELVRRARPDLVVATGDLVDMLAEAADPLAAALRNVGARDGAVAIVGNHDHYAGPGEVVERLRRGGVRVLQNQGVVLRPGDGGGFAMLGVDDLQGRRRPLEGFAGPDLGRALADVPADRPRILLAHQPIFFHESQGRVALQLSGHTHGGQIRPLTSPVTAFWEFVRGRYERQGSTLWVNRGFGTTGPPSRVGSPPEVTRIVLVSA